MRSLILYYSHSGNTAYVAEELLYSLRQKGQADIFELEYTGRRKSLTRRLFYRIAPSLVKLKAVPLDLKDYDLLCLGIPVIAGAPPPALIKFIYLCKNLDNKRVICFYVYGIAASAEKCDSFVRKLLLSKGRTQITSMFVPWADVYNEQYLGKAIHDTLSKASLVSSPI